MSQHEASQARYKLGAASDPVRAHTVLRKVNPAWLYMEVPLFYAGNLLLKTGWLNC